MQYRVRHRWGPAVVMTTAFALAVGSQGAAVALPNAPAKTDREFTSSFEEGDPAPDWVSTVDTGADGGKRSSGVDGGFSTGIPGNVTEHVTRVRASAENTNGGEVKENLADNEPGTKWLTFAPTGWVEFDLDAPTKIVKYALTSANDHSERDPRDWTLKGSADGESWQTLDTRSGETFGEPFTTKTYDLAEAAEFQHFRLEITKNNGAGDALQLGDVQFSTGDAETPAPEDMLSFVDEGPTSSPTAKANAGFTGTHALRYAGRHTADGRAYSYNKVFDVDVKVDRRTELSYKIFPAMADRDLDYDATNVSVDLAFTDGTYLSDLKATDQHGFPLTPRGQGDAKILYVNQWNSVESGIGSVAAGKTVDRILVAYDSPKGPAKFRGWLDDVEIKRAEPERPKAHLSDYALTTRGTNSSGSFSRGNNFPATAVPHGFNFWTPVTNAGTTSWLYDYASGNNDDNLPTLQAFGASHEPSPWMGDRQTFQVMPSAASGTPDTSRDARELAFRHENETARPYYYGVRFENGLKAEMAPTDHAAMMRFTYPGDDASVIFDNVEDKGGLTLDKENGTFSGYSDVKSGGSAGATRLFVYGEFDSKVTGGEDTGGVKGHLRFDAGRDRAVTMRIATSLLGVDQAKDNLRQELPKRASFEKVKRDAQKQWDRILGKVEVEGATRDQLTTLYSSLYRLYLYPNSGHEKVDGKYKYASPFSKAVKENTPTETGAKVVDGKVYVNNGFWDTYRTTWPAYSFLTPSKAGELVDGFVQHYKDGGWTSRWSSPGYADLMTGTSSDVAFADAYVKGVDFDAKAAYDAALKNATVVPPSSGVGRKGMETSPFLGYTGTETHEGLSWALEGYLNDYGIAKMGEKLYKETGEKRYKDESAYFLNRAQDYVNLFDSKAGFFQGKDTKGDWRVDSEKYDPRVWGYDYTETNGWGYAFTAPQDSRGLANLYGGRNGLGDKLDEYLSTPETASPDLKGSYGGVIHEMTEARDVRMGMYGHSNQVAHHALYMYDAAGQPYKTQKNIREVLQRLYTGSEIGQGYHGDEDNGEQSAWFLFSSLGFYPLVMGSGEYAVGSPLFTKATVHLENGRKLVVKAPKNSTKNVYVQGLKVNGKRWTSTSLPHSLISKGGVLEFDMGAKPSSWGTGENAAPPSITKDDEVPTPRADAITGEGLLFDDTSATDATVTSVDLPVADKGAKALQYTLTSSADRTKAPAGWKLQGSADGKTWRTLDRRSGESFAWDRQTRAFSVKSPGTYAKYRLVLDGEHTLSEVELLS
ncbi:MULTISPECIES: GH92 family glycosyl hydrolase [Streptomyces]|uniref:GH92 family glycosyl hydrolase n=1 Tax=Streptomyces TaxID=1883 RepID=UPI001CCE8A26|nr:MULTISPECIES: GH92 family glycosyl hydrolase [Streptomyces]MBZ6171704.1 GH92 family glycosyl hydrolase [Streptomyces olivaceus]MBZ6184296.1 GH92 family glycosyl hydrolase [Streptomyces olivaceus]MCM8549529.1 GH92 family glycosyl hydrolase [Streptomyces sp. STCH 565 A]